MVLDLPRGSAGAALLLIAGAFALTLPAVVASWLPRAVARLFPAPGSAAPGRVTRAIPLLAGLVLAVPAAVLAIDRLGATFPAPAAWALPAVLVVIVLVALAPAALARFSAPFASGWRWLSVALCGGAAVTLFVSTHRGEGTLMNVRSGTELLHVALFSSTLGVTALTAGLLGLAADDVWAASLSLRVRAILGAGALLLGAGCLFADRWLLVDLYPHVHRWLTFSGLVSVAAGFALLSPQRLREKALPLRIAASAVVAISAVALALFGSRAPSGTRAEINEAPAGKAILEILARPKVAPSATSHPLLAIDQLLDEPGPPGQPNILLITVDALRADQLDAGLPALDRLASESVRFRRVYTQGTRTAVAVGALMRGTYSAHIDWRLMIYKGGKIHNPTKLTKAQKKAWKNKFVYTAVPAEGGPPMLAERLQKKGVYTMAAPYAGDNEFFYRGGSYDHGWDAFEDMTKANWDPPTSDKIAAVALQQLDAVGQRRWFQWVHFYDPHEAKGTKSQYDKMVRSFDTSLGKLLDTLSSRGLLKNTILILSADHGEALGDHGNKTHASSLYDAQSRVPLLIRVPGVAARTIEEPVALIDLNATIAVAAGADTSGLDGVNLWPAIFSGKYPKRRPVFIELHRYYASSGSRTTDLKGVVLDDHKLIVDRLKGTEQLFSLKDDPGELTSVLTKQPERAAELRAVLDAFLVQAEAQHPLP